MAEFSNTISALNEGQVETDLSIALKELVVAVRDTGKGGKIVFTIDIAKDRQDPRLIRILTDIKVKKPEPPRKGETFYLGNNGNTLISLDDTQIQLPFGGPQPEPKFIDLPQQQEGNQ